MTVTIARPVRRSHPRDCAARRHPKGPLVLGIYDWWYDGEVNDIKMKSGKLCDCFYRVQDDGMESWSKEKVLLQRALPIWCHACQGVILNDEVEMLQHCAHCNHILNAKSEVEQIPQRLVDPWRNPDYEALEGALHKKKLLSEHRSSIIFFLL